MIPNNQFWFNNSYAYNYILDNYGLATAAYSLRRLSKSYFGPCIKVRRVSDNSTQDIYFNGNDLDSTEIFNFSLGSDCYVDTLYDQSGNGLDLINTTIATQPKIANSGVVIKSNNKPSIYFETNTRYLKASTASNWKFLHDGTPNSFYFVSQSGVTINPNSQYGLFGTNNGSSANRGVYLSYNDVSTTYSDQVSYFVTNANGNPNTGPVRNDSINDNLTPNTPILISGLMDPSNADYSLRSELIISNYNSIATNLSSNTGAPSALDPASALTLGGYGTSGDFIGYFQEAIFYSVKHTSELNRTIGVAITNYYNLYDSFMSKRLIAKSVAHTRYDASSIIEVSNDNYLIALTKFGPNPDDLDASEIAIYSTSDFITLTEISVISPDNYAVMIPSLYKKNNGGIVLVFLDAILPDKNKIAYYISNDNGVTWINKTYITTSSLEYHSPAPDRIFKTNTGRLLYPYNINVGGGLGSATGNYDGRIAYSDDDGDSWLTISGTTVSSPDGLCVEQGIFQKQIGVLTQYVRNRSGVIYASDSYDDGLSWSVVYDMGVDAANAMSTVVKMNSSGFIASYNPFIGGRKKLNISYSLDSYVWAKEKVIKSDLVLDQIEPTIYEFRGKLYIYYSIGSSGGWDFYVSIIPINTYLNVY